MKAVIYIWVRARSLDFAQVFRFVLLIAVATLLARQCACQQVQWGRVALGSGFMFTAGVANGTNEAISHHYPQFKKRFPKANHNFWDPRLSWRNKYMHGDPEQGPAYPGSMNALVWTTDAYHATNYIRTGGLVIGTFTLTIGEKRPLWHYLLEFGIGAASYSAGNYITYNILFK